MGSGSTKDYVSITKWTINDTLCIGTINYEKDLIADLHLH